MARTWRIGEVSRRTGLTPRTLRHYDDLGLLVPSGRTLGDYRIYDEDDLLRLLQIQNLKAIGLGLAEIAEALTDPSLDATATLNGHLARLEEQIAAEQQLAGRLRALAASQRRSWDDVMDAIALSRLHSHGDPMLRLRAALDPRGRETPELLRALAEESDPAVAEVLVWSLAQQPDAAAAALAALPSAAAELRRLLARLLGKLGAAAAVPQLIGLLDDPDARVATAAVGALGQLGAGAAASALVAQLGAGPIADADLIDALAAIGADAVEPLLAVIAEPEGPDRSAAFEALGRIGATLPSSHDRIAAALAAHATAGRRAERLATLVALASLGEPGRSVLAGLITDPDVAGIVARLLEAQPG